MPSPSTLYVLNDAILFTGEAMVEGHSLLVRNGLIVDIVAHRSVPIGAVGISFADHILAPGFIDAQVNGGGDILFNAAPTAESCLKIAAAHRKFGTTHILPTCISDTPEVTRQAIQAVRESRQKDSGILGIHLEGPHLGLEARGIHAKEHIRGINQEDLRLYTHDSGEIMLLTVAPENATPQYVHALHENGCVISLGHSNALSEQVNSLLEIGASGFTHLFNGMGCMSARAPGIAGVALDDRRSWCGIIADGHHVSAEMIRLALRAKPAGKVFLISDAMPPAASDAPQPFQLCGETIRVENGCCVNAQGRLAGSAITLLDAVRHCVKHVGVELDEALRMASAYPAAFLGCDKKLGKLLPGYAASAVALKPDLSACAPWFKKLPVSG